MFVKRFKRKCDVRGCKNTANVFLISKRREMGNTIAICTDCLKEAQSSIDGYVEEKKVVIREDRPLFPHPELKVTLSSVADVEPKPKEVIEETEDIPTFNLSKEGKNVVVIMLDRAPGYLLPYLFAEKPELQKREREKKTRFL